MCWKTSNEINSAVLTAEKDIPVFKVVNIAVDGTKSGDPVSQAYPYYRYDAGFSGYTKDMLSLMSRKRMRRKTYLYEAGNTYSASGFARNALHCSAWRWERDEGIHSYSPECELERIDNWNYVRFGPNTIDEYVDKDYAFSTLRIPGVMDCVIPKGARYCVNERGEYVSDSIRVTGFAPMESRVKK